MIITPSVALLCCQLLGSRPLPAQFGTFSTTIIKYYIIWAIGLCVDLSSRIVSYILYIYCKKYLLIHKIIFNSIYITNIKKHVNIQQHMIIFVKIVKSIHSYIGGRGVTSSITSASKFLSCHIDKHCNSQSIEQRLI